MTSLPKYLFALCFTLVASPASAATRFVEWSSINAGTGGGIDATVVSTVNAGSLETFLFNATDPVFISEFADSFKALRYHAPLVGSADIESTISFTPALPEGAQLLIIDVDVRLETATLSGAGNPLNLLGQTETWDGAVSTFPNYDAGAGRLVAEGFENFNEASIFDLSGLSAIDVDFSGGGLSSAIFVAVALPVPLPMALYLLGPAVAVLGLTKRKA